MEAVAILIISILGLTLLVVAVVSAASNLDKDSFIRNTIKTAKQKQLTKEEKKKLKNKFRQGRPNSIQPIKIVQKYKYPEATKRHKERMEKLMNAEQEKEENKYMMVKEVEDIRKIRLMMEDLIEDIFK